MRFAVYALGFLTVAFPFVTFGAPAARTDPIDDRFLSGYLSWDDGVGRIRWGSPPPSADAVDTGNNWAGRVDEFVSDPIDRTLYLNVSRNVQLDLYFKANALVIVHVEINTTAGFLTGGMGGGKTVSHSDYVKWGPSTPKPGASGYNVSAHRMPAELDAIPKGAVLRIRVIRSDGTESAPAPHPYGFGEDFPSALRIPTFSAEELVYRLAKFQNSRAAFEPSGPGQGPADEVLLGRLLERVGLGAALLVGVKGRGRRHVLPVLLVLGTALSGCVAGKTEGPAPEANTGLGGAARSFLVSDDENETGLLEEGYGSVFGAVADADELPVSGANAFLLQTRFFARTNPFGSFRFSGVAPGSYQLHVDREGFKPLETTITVESGKLTRVDVILEFANPREGVYFRPHRHDYWGGKTSITYDTGTSSWCMPPPVLILPGTVDIEVVHNNTLSVLNLVTTRADDFRNLTALYPRPAGTPFHLRTTWEMTDPGHSTYSYWGCFGTTGGFGDNYNPGKLIVTIHKGVVPYEPPHRNLWGNATTYSVIKEESKAVVADCLNVCPLYKSTGLLKPTLAAFNVSWEPLTFVPPETGSLQVVLRASRAMTSVSTPWVLHYFDAGQGRTTPCDPFTMQRDWGPKGKIIEAPLTTSDDANLQWVYTIPVNATSADRTYARHTNWCFFAAPKDQVAAAVDYYTNQNKTPILTLDVTATKAPDEPDP